MKKINFLFLASAMAASSMAMQSCLDDDDSSNDSQIAVVTVCPESTGSFYMQLDPTTRLIPSNLSKSPFGEKTVRALVSYDVLGPNNELYDDIADVNVRVNQLDSIMTRQLSPDLGLDNVLKYGDSPVDLIADWMTVAECGYLTLRVRIPLAGTQTKPNLSLVRIPSTETRPVFSLFNDCKGNTSGPYVDKLIAFDLRKVIEECNTPNPEFVVNWKSPRGNRSCVFKMNMIGDGEHLIN